MYVYFEHIHRTQLSRLPRVARIQSSFAMREILNRRVPPAVFHQRPAHRKPAAQAASGRKR
ncbi:hypothetical protein DC522_27090 [Microvirga sp. KLBC 81]|nr:hypothetical protein DC522_27090 [Microvirga sp. KLBC 81]